MKQILFILIFIFSNITTAQQLKIYYEPIEGGGYKVFADNNELCPVSVKINFKMTNLRVLKGNNKVFIVPPKSNRVLLTGVDIIKPNKKYKI